MPGSECPEQDEGSRETDCSRAGLQAPTSLPLGWCPQAGYPPLGRKARQEASPWREPTGVSLLVAVAQFLGLPGHPSYCCEREILPEVMLEA